MQSIRIIATYNPRGSEYLTPGLEWERMDFECQGHRGARGLIPENTLSSFEAALDAGASSIETDLHLTRDGVPVLIHDPIVPGTTFPVANLTLAELRTLRVDRNPDPVRFPHQQPRVLPRAQKFALDRGIDPWCVPTLAELFAFTDIVLDLELKRVAFHPEAIGDDFDGTAPGLFGRAVFAEIERADALQRTRVRSFDHRAVRAMKTLAPRLRTGILIAATTPIDPVRLVRDAGADFYAPEFFSLDARQVEALRHEGIDVLPWTVNRPEDWQRLFEWGVAGITTDYPDRLRTWLSQRG